MSNKQLKDNMTALLKELLSNDTTKSKKDVIAKAVTLGMAYQKEKIREGINIVFQELDQKNQ